MESLNMILFLFMLSSILVSSSVSSSNLCLRSTPLTKNVNDFGFKLISKLDHKGNLIISPVSIYTAMVMTYMGAEKNTAIEIKHALQSVRNGLIDSKLQNSLKALLENFLKHSEGNYSVTTANGLFLKSGFPVKEKYIHEVKEFSQGIVEQLDFKAGKETKKKINGWVSKSTHGMIKEMISDADLSTKFIILSAIYFKGLWDTPFDQKSTYDGSFQLIGGGKNQVKMMQMADRPWLLFHEDQHTGYKYLELPYKGGNIVMLLAMPRAIDLPTIPMSTSEICDIFAKLKGHNMEIVAIPKFIIQYQNELKDSLKALGIRDLFTRSANLKGITEAANLSVSSVKHKAVIKVDEKGSVASAATKVVPPGAPPPNAKYEFIADHPFMFYIIEKKSGLIIFTGRITEPEYTDT